MNFDLTEEQKQLVASAAAFVRKESPVRRFRAARDEPLGYRKETWRQMGELGWLALPFGEAVGGLQGSFLDVALVLEELGTQLVPEPYLASVVLAGRALALAADAQQQQRWLSPMLQGETTLALAYAERQSRHDVADVSTVAEAAGPLFRLRGEKIFVLNGHAADALVVSARSPSGLALFVVEKSAKGMVVAPVNTTDGARAATVTFRGTECALLGAAGSVPGVLDELMDAGAAAACAQGVGVLRAVLDMTREHLRTREQFGAKLGTFQALQHRAAEMLIELELARSATILAALAMGSTDPLQRQAQVSAAKAQLAMSGRFVTQQAIQLHGGIGITDEHDVGLYFKRMLVLNALFGDEAHHVARYASLPGF